MIIDAREKLLVLRKTPDGTIVLNGNRILDHEEIKTVLSDIKRFYAKITPEIIAEANSPDEPHVHQKTKNKEKYRGHIKSKRRKAIFSRDRWKCRYCGSETELTLDHVIPICRGGLSSNDNLVTCCRPCNRRKYKSTPQEAGMELRSL